MKTIINKKFLEKFYCQRCKTELTKEQNNEAIKNKFLLLCEKCEPEIKEKLEKWYPKFQQMKL